MGLDTILSMSVPMLKASATLIAERKLVHVSFHGRNVHRRNLPQPSTLAAPIPVMIAHGTAVRAFDASSLICTGASKPPVDDISNCLLKTRTNERTNGPQRCEKTEDE